MNKALLKSASDLPDKHRWVVDHDGLTCEEKIGYLVALAQIDPVYPSHPTIEDTAIVLRETFLRRCPTSN